MKLVKKYKNFELNIDIDEIKKKSLIVFSGVSGSGKTTAINEIISSTNFKKNNKVFMDSYTEFLSPIKVKDLISLSQNKDFKSLYYNKLKISELLDTEINKLSKGEQRRVYFYMCISTKADFYIFDEPFSYLDKEMKEIVREIIEDLSNTYIVIVSSHYDTFRANRTTYILENGKLLEKKDYSFSYECNKDINKPIIIHRKNKKIFLNHIIKIIPNTLVFTLIIAMISMIFSGFNSVQSLRMSIDTLGIFNSQNGVVVEPNKIEFDYDNLISNYERISEEENLELIHTYSFAKSMNLHIGNNVYRIDDLYTYNSEFTKGFYSSANNPYLIEYFKKIYLDKTNFEIVEVINQYDFINNPITLNISGSLYDVEFSKDIKIVGLNDSTYFFSSNLSVLDFYRTLNENIYIVTSSENIEKDKPILIQYTALKSGDNSSDYLKYLSNKYNSYEYTLDSQGNIVASDNKNISIEQYNDYFDRNSNVFAYSYDDDLFCLKNVDFFRNNNFSYVGELKQENNAVIVSKNYVLRYFNDQSIDNHIGENIIINGETWKINCILDQVIDDNVYFCSEDYLNYIAPLYSYRVELLVVDYLNLENILMDLNENDIGFNSKLNIANKVDYTQHIMSLKSTQQNLMNLKSTFMILAIIMIGLLISFSGILVIKSYRLYTTLNSLYINMTKEKILTIIIGVGLSMALMLLMCDTLSNLINQTIFVEINKSLSDFPITNNEIKIEYNWTYILLSFITLMIGELFNGKKINYWIKKIFKKV